MKKKKDNSECSLLIQKVQSGRVVEDDHILERWYIRLIAYFLTPLYLAIKIYDLTKFVKRMFDKFLSGLLQIFLFLFCFGWFWQTSLLEKFRQTKPARVIIRYKLHYHLLNISSTILQAYFIRLLLPLPPEYNSHITFTCGIYTLFAVVLSAKSTRYHCFCLLVLPTLASRHGRRVILVLLVASVCLGPIHNIQINTELVSREMNCISEKAKNNSDTVTDLMKERYDALHTRIEGLQNTTKKRMAEIQEKIDKVGDQVRNKYSFLQSVVNKVNTFADKCHKTMGKLNTKCKNLFDDGCKKDKRDVAGITYYNQTEHFLTTLSPVEELPNLTINQTLDNAVDLSPLETNVYHNKSQFLAHHPVSTLHGGKVYHVRQKRFWNDVVCFLKKVVGFIARPICSIIFNSINFMCSVPKLLTHFIAGIILQKYEYLQLTFQNNLRLEVNSSVVFEKDVIEVRSAKEAMEKFRERVVDRITFDSLDWVALGDYLKLITMLMVYVSAYKYLSKYLTDTTFDNLYLDRALEKYNAYSDKGIFPLNTKERGKYVRISQAGMTAAERYMVTRSSLKALIYCVAVLVVEGCDRILVLVCTLLFKYGPLTVEHSIQLSEEDENGESLLPEDLSTVHLTLDTTSCFQQPAVTDLSVTGYHLALSSGLLILSVTQVFFLRFRHAVCDSFYPVRRKKRAEYLHNKIRKARSYKLKHAAEEVFTRISERNKLCRMFPWLYKPQCVLCSGRENIQKCDWCQTVYCKTCLNDIDDKCRVCSDMTYRRKSGLIESASKYL